MSEGRSDFAGSMTTKKSRTQDSDVSITPLDQNAEGLQMDAASLQNE